MPSFSWLHLSDLHIRNTAIDESYRDSLLYGKGGKVNYKRYDVSRNEGSFEDGGIAYQIQLTPVDCIVITGDIFYQGRWTKKEEHRVFEFIKEIYDICKDAKGWISSSSDSFERLFYCPGNHDLNRSAVYISDEESMYRDEILSSVVDMSHKLSSGNGNFFPESENHRKLFINESFRHFFSSMKNITKISMEGDNCYEARLFQVPDQSAEVLPVCFLALNTSILAGQRYNEIDDEIYKAYEKFFCTHVKQDTEKALKEYTDYHELIQKARGLLVRDRGYLCFPSEIAIAKIEESLSRFEDHPIVVMFGHHPIDYLSDAANIKMNCFAAKHRSKIYLCGHGHIPVGDYRAVHVNTHNTQSMYEVATGGIFPDERGYSHTGFSIGTLVQETPSGTAQFIINVYEYCYTAFSEYKWRQDQKTYEIDVPLTGPKSQSVDLQKEQALQTDIVDIKKKNEDKKLMTKSSLGQILDATSEFPIQEVNDLKTIQGNIVIQDEGYLRENYSPMERTEERETGQRMPISADEAFKRRRDHFGREKI